MMAKIMLSMDISGYYANLGFIPHDQSTLIHGGLHTWGCPHSWMVFSGKAELIWMVKIDGELLMMLNDCHYVDLS